MQHAQLGNIAGKLIEFRLIPASQPSGRDLVLLHEALGSVAMWKDFPDRLATATGCRVLVYSRLGHGRSSAPPAPRTRSYLHDEACVWLPRVLEHFALQTPVLVGHSDGATIALIHAAQPGADIAGVVAIAPHVMVEDVTVAGVAAAKRIYETTPLRDRLAPYHDDPDAVFWAWNRLWLDPSFRDWSVENVLPSIRTPVLALQGEQDEYATLEQLARIEVAVAGSRTVALPDCRHSPHRDQQAAVLQHIQAFVALTAP